MPSCAICSASLALRVIASSSASQPNSAASRRRTVSMFGSSTCHMWYDGRLVREIEIALEGLVDDARARAAAAVVQIDDGAVERERLLDLAPVVLVRRDRAGAAFCTAARRPAPALRCRRGTPRRAPAEPEALRNWRRDNMASSLSERCARRFSVFRTRLREMTQYPDPGRVGPRRRELDGPLRTGRASRWWWVSPSSRTGRRICSGCGAAAAWRARRRLSTASACRRDIRSR